MTEKQRVRTLCVDFDGVIHSYTSGWKGECNIPDPPVEGAFDWLAGLILSGKFAICIYSSRSKFPGAIDAMKKWFNDHNLIQSYIDLLQFPTEKPSAFLTIDDRAICFNGVFPTEEFIVNFKTWQQRDLVPLNETDEGELASKVFIDPNSLHIVQDFIKPVKWLAMSSDEARAAAAVLSKKADELDVMRRGLS